MTTAGNFRSAVMAVIGFGFVLSLVAPSRAEPADDRNFAALQADAQKVFREKISPFITTYCLDCHGNKKRKGGFNFQPAFKKPGGAESNQLWKKAFANVKAHDMPPDDADKQPTDAERKIFLDWIPKAKFFSPKDPGPFVIRRLTKVEYGNTLHDLFGVEPAVAKDLPDEVFGEGYLNTLSPLQSEQYLAIANDVLDRILAPVGKPPTAVQKRLFGEPPAQGTDARAAAKNVARSLARKAYRRPASDAEVDVLLGVFDLATKNKLAYPAALRLMLKAVLVSPQFLFITPAKQAESGQAIVPLDDLSTRVPPVLSVVGNDAGCGTLRARRQSANSASPHCSRRR